MAVNRRGWWIGAGTLAVSAAAVPIFARRAARPDEVARTVRDAIVSRQWGRAESILVPHLRRHPEDGRAWLQLGSVRGLLGREEEALAALRRVPEVDPAWPRAQVLIGDLAQKRYDAAGAERAYRAALAREPDAIVPREKLLGLLFALWRKDEAITILADLHRLTADSRHLVAWTGLSLEEAQPQQLRELSGELARLEADLDRFLSKAPDDPWLRRARGLLRFEQGRTAEARADLEAVAHRIEDDPVGRLALGECLMSLGDRSGLDASLGPVPDRPAQKARWWLLKGQAAQAGGMVDEAIEGFREAVAADPRNRAAQYHLGRALLGLGRTEEAGPSLERAERIRIQTDALKKALDQRRAGVSDAAECERIARLFLDAEMPPEARGWFQQTVWTDPLRGEAQIALARLGEVSRTVAGSPRLRSDSVATDTPRAVIATAATARARLSFEDIAAEAGLVFSYDAAPRGDLFIGDTMGGGVGLLDLDGDGWLDVYFVNGCPLPFDPRTPPAPNRLFRNRGDGTFEDVTARAGVGGRGYGMGCAVGDYNGDGRDDLFVTGLASTVLYRNNGDGTFTDVTESAGVFSSRWGTAAGFADLDADGDLDLVVVTYVEADPRRTLDCRDSANQPIHCPPGKYPAQVDHLFRNDGDGTFTDVAAEAGLDVPDGRGLGLAIADLDGDGRLDLYVANDAEPDFLFRNLGGLKFEEIGVVAGVAYNGDGLATASMGVVASDLDGDGLLDLFHTNFRNEGSLFLRNQGGGLFSDATAGAGLNAPSRAVTGFGAVALDADNDGLLDLFAANGHVDHQPWAGLPMAQPPHLYSALAPGRFVLADPASSGPYFSKTLVGRGAAAGDLDNDGRVDLVVVHRDAPAALLRNTSRAGRWLSLRLVGTASGSTPVGVRVTCRVGGRALVRSLSGGTGYLSAHDSRLSFGLGDAERAESIEIAWPSGLVQRFTDLASDRFHTVREGDQPVAIPPSREP
jgi:tetratricopeptide (TPR) repeat protein